MTLSSDLYLIYTVNYYKHSLHGDRSDINTSLNAVVARKMVFALYSFMENDQFLEDFFLVGCKVFKRFQHRIRSLRLCGLLTLTQGRRTTQANLHQLLPPEFQSRHLFEMLSEHLKSIQTHTHTHIYIKGF